MKNLLIIFIFTFNIFASSTNDVSKNFTIIANKVVSIVKNKKLNASIRNDKIIQAITPIFDFTLMAKLSLGKKWKTMKKTNQKQFIQLYVKRMKKSYSSKIDSYTDERIVVNSVDYQVSKKTGKILKSRIILDTSLISSGDETKVVYKYYKPKKAIKNKEKWLIYDVIIAGVSIVKTDKAQFKAVLKESTIDELMKKLNKNL